LFRGDSALRHECKTAAIDVKWVSQNSVNVVPGGADKSLSRPEWKKATATKLGIYST